MPHQTLVQLSRRQARRLMLARLGLWPPRAGQGKEGVVAFVRRVGSIQYDPINVVARNPDLVLQARISDYRPRMLEELLYEDRALLDGWDKMACIFQLEDWPFFARHRRAMAAHYEQRLPEAVKRAPEVLAAIRQHGPLSPTDFKTTASIEGFWGRPMRLANGALQYLQEAGALGIHSRVGAKRVYDLIENLLPSDLMGAPEPHPLDRDYHRWHLLRRTKSMGVVQERAGVHWSGVLNLSSAGRRKLLSGLVDEGRLAALSIEGLEGRTCYAVSAGLDSLLEMLSGDMAAPPEVSLLAPLDNLLWDRDLVRLLFNFAYVWEVYKPAKSRQFGYYVLPVLYGDQIVGRCEPRLDRTSNTLKLVGWWWEDGFEPDDPVREAVSACLDRFAAFTGATRIEVQPEAEGLVRLGYDGTIGP